MKTITCDQVAWILDVFDRYLPNDPAAKRVSCHREMMKYGMLYEVMDVAGLRFEDESARLNGTPHQARKYPDEVDIIDGKSTDSNCPGDAHLPTS